MFDVKNPNADVILASFAKGVNSLAKQLDIITHYALPHNAKAKPIERFFRTFEEKFGKLWQSYCGNNPNNRSRRLKNLKRNQYPTFEDWGIKTKSQNAI